MTAALFLVLLIVGALGATAAAAWQLPPAFFAGGIAAAFIGLACAAAATAVGLEAHGDLSEARERRGPSNPEPLPSDVTRPVFNRLWLAALGAFAVLGVVPLVALARRPSRSSYTGWRAGVRLVDENNRPIPVDYLVDGGAETVFPEGGVEIPLAPAMLIRVSPGLLTPAMGAMSGYLAFSKVCTHAGCPVALYRHAAHELMCPCHQSLFDVLANATVRFGPAPRPLPQLALSVDPAGYLIARGDFNAPVGPDDWSRVT